VPLPPLTSTRVSPSGRPSTVPSSRFCRRLVSSVMNHTFLLSLFLFPATSLHMGYGMGKRPYGETPRGDTLGLMSYEFPFEKSKKPPLKFIHGWAISGRFRRICIKMITISIRSNHYVFVATSLSTKRLVHSSIQNGCICTSASSTSKPLHKMS
jgi:hypothetical protein